jgi:uncharacterized protein (UPF0332 family)
LTGSDGAALLRKANQNIAAARYLLSGGYAEVALTRAYYAMFYCAQALLLGKGVVGGSHKRVITAFGREFVRTGEAPEALHRYLIEAQRERHLADYMAAAPLADEDAERAIRQAEEMLRFAYGSLEPPDADI